MENRNEFSDLKWDPYFEQNLDEDNYNDFIDLSRDDSEFLISILSGINFTETYKEFIVKTLKRIVDESMNLNHFIFKEVNISQKDIINNFKKRLLNINTQLIKGNKSMENIKVNETINEINNIAESNTMDKKEILEKEEKKIININKTKKTEINTNSNNYNNYFNLQTKKHNKTFEKELNIFNNSERSNSPELLNQTKTTNLFNDNKNIGELKDIKETFNLNEDMYELFVQSIIFLTLKCFEQDDKNEFNFIFNLKNTMDKFKDITDVELDFAISNLEPILFKSFLNYFKDNIIFFNYNSYSFEIKLNNKDNSLNEIIENIDETKKIDILGEILQSSWKDKSKFNQIEKYCLLMKLFKNELSSKNSAISNFKKYLKFENENQKLILFITDSSYEYIFKSLNKSELLNEVKKKYTESDKKANVNVILLLLSLGLEKRALLNDYSIKNKKNIDNEILDKIRIPNNKILNSNLFKKSCYQLDEFLNHLKNIELKYINIYKNILDENCNFMVENYISSKKIKFKLDKFDDYKKLIDIKKIKNKKDKEFIYIILYFYFQDKENNNFENELKTKIKKYKFFKFKYSNRKDINKENKKSLETILKLEQENKLNSIQFLIFQDVREYNFRKILEKIQINEYDHLFFNKKSNYPNSLEWKYLMHIFNNYNDFFKYLERTKSIFEEKFSLIKEFQFLYNKFINVYNESFNNGLLHIKDNNIKSLIQKVNEDLFFKFNLHILEKEEEENNDNYASILFHSFELESEIEEININNEKRITSFIAALKGAFNYNINFSEVENKMKEVNKNITFQGLVCELLLYLKENVYPKIKLGILKSLLTYELNQFKEIGTKLI